MGVCGRDGERPVEGFNGFKWFEIKFNLEIYFSTCKKVNKEQTFKSVAIDFVARISSTKFLFAVAVIGLIVWGEVTGRDLDIEQIMGVLGTLGIYTAGNIANKNAYTRREEVKNAVSN